MKGKIKPQTRFEAFRRDIIDSFDVRSDFCQFLVSFSNVEGEMPEQFYPNKTIDYDATTNPALIYFQVLRLADKPVMLRDLEKLSALVSRGTKWNTNCNLYRQLSILYSLGVIDYTIRDKSLKPSDGILISLKD